MKTYNSVEELKDDLPVVANINYRREFKLDCDGNVYNMLHSTASEPDDWKEVTVYEECIGFTDHTASLYSKDELPDHVDDYAGYGHAKYIQSFYEIIDDEPDYPVVEIDGLSYGTRYLKSILIAEDDGSYLVCLPNGSGIDVETVWL